MVILLSIACLLGALCTYNAYCLLLNYRRASELNIPIAVVPISPDNPLWIALQTGLSPIFRYVPLEKISFTRYCRLGWEFHDRYKTHQRLGDEWILVTPAKNWFHTSQADAAHDILTRSREFGRPVWMMNALNVFGPNVATAEGSDWQRQRKLTATPFNEQKSRLVWDEAIRQASDMVDSWLSDSEKGSKSTSEDTRTLALHVLAYVAFKKSYPFKSVAKSSEVQEPSTYRDSLAIVLRNVLVVIVLPAIAFRLPFTPTKWKNIGLAVTNFQKYMLDQLADEKRLIAEGKPGSGTLMENLVRASNVPENEKPTTNKKAPNEMRPLSVSEILGNVFVFNFAGHDTTAISLAYSTLLLVAHPSVQDWICEELNFYLPSTARSPEEWNYEANFPHLKRCLAVLLETLRLYNPLPGVPKYTGAHPRTISFGGADAKSITLPPDTLVVANLMALQTHPRYWGDDSLVWRPQRWIHCSPSSDLKDETLFTPRKGTFIAWSEGARSCPGRKFAQVEFVATMAAVFRGFRAEPVRMGGESADEARKRVLGVVKDSNVELLLQMREPESVRVRWVRR